MNLECSNIEELQEMQQLIQQMDTEGNPWMPSKQKKFLYSQRGPYVEAPELNKAYFLSEGTGSIYNGNNSVGYFQVGAIVVYTADMYVKVSGVTFKVTSDGPHPTWVAPYIAAEGHTIKERPPRIMELSEVIQNAKQLG